MRTGQGDKGIVRVLAGDAGDHGDIPQKAYVGVWRPSFKPNPI